MLLMIARGGASPVRNRNSIGKCISGGNRNIVMVVSSAYSLTQIFPRDAYTSACVASSGKKMKQLVINFVTPHIHATKFSGGIYSILKHADLLARKGHKVNIIPHHGSAIPTWLDCSAEFILLNEKKPSRFERACLRLSGFRPFMKSAAGNAAMMEYLMAGNIPVADITIATHWETVDLVMQFGTGKRAQFGQHFESIFEASGSVAKSKASTCYLLPIYKMANSKWLKETLELQLNCNGIKEEIFRFVNGVDLTTFRPIKHSEESDDTANSINIISYGGRQVPWKGFKEMAEAIALTRNKLPTHQINWLVYGGAALPADNDVAPYKDLGFLQQKELAKAYNSADILLSASWYESFPLFPLEAMACGLATITGEFGTEDYALHGQNCEVVNSRDPENISNALTKLILDKEYRKTLAKNGIETASQFGWEQANETVESALLAIADANGDFSHQTINHIAPLEELMY